MMPARSAALRALARPSNNFLAKSSKQPALNQRYSSTGTAKEAAKSSEIPWLAAAILMTAGGTWLAFRPRTSAHHSPEHSEHSTEEEKPETEKPAEHPIADKVSEKVEKHKEELAKIKAQLPKPERDGKSVENHAKAAETNEHKVRKGKFSEEEFDNHITKHTSDPSKDFEIIEKEEAEGSS